MREHPRLCDFGLYRELLPQRWCQVPVWQCPFGSKWFCSGDSTTICKQEGFSQTCTGTGQLGKGESCANLYKQCDCQSTYKYACSGTGYSGGTGSACNGKYTACTCASNYHWETFSEACIPDSPVCEVGTLYYSDYTCSDKLESSKTLLGVVIYSNGTSGGGWIMTVKPIQTGLYWSTRQIDIPGLTNITSSSNLTDIQASCTNTDVITAYGSSSEYPAAWAAKNYKPTGTPRGKSWCLPSGGLLNNINNSTNFAKVNTGITTAGGTTLENIFGGYGNIWSSSEYDNYRAWTFYAHSSGSFYMSYTTKDTNYYGSKSVHPVMEF